MPRNGSSWSPPGEKSLISQSSAEAAENKIHTLWMVGMSRRESGETGFKHIT